MFGLSYWMISTKRIGGQWLEERLNRAVVENISWRIVTRKRLITCLSDASHNFTRRKNVVERNNYGAVEQESHAVAGKPRDAAVNSDRYRVCWHFAGAISVSRMQLVSGCTLYA